MIKFNFCFLKQREKILLLNRESPSWMGCWNGIGGKLEPNEDPRTSMLREIEEETKINELILEFKGLITWNIDGGKRIGGMYTYVGIVSDEYKYNTPIKVDEGILDWKDISWILHPENLGVSKNIPKCLEKVLYDERVYDHHYIYRAGEIVDSKLIPIEVTIETNESMREEYLSKYLDEGSGIR